MANNHVLRRQTGLVILTYALLTIIITWPVINNLGSAVPGKIGDAYVHLWTFNWLKDVLLTGQNPFYTTRIFYPHGVSLFNHNLAWVNFLIWLPIQAFVSATAAYSLSFMAIFVFNGLAIYSLTREITKSFPAAFISGLVGGFWPYNLSHHGHPNLILIGWLALHLFYLHKAFAQKKRRHILLAALFLALIGLTRWQLLFMSSFAIGLFVFYEFRNENRLPFPQRLRILLSVWGFSFIMMAPLLLPLVNYQLTRPYPEDVFVDEVAYGADMMAYFVPSRYHPLWGDSALALSQNFSGNRLYVRTIGYITLLLVLIGLINNWRRARFWLLMAAVYWGLALGPDLYLNGKFITPLPYQWVQEWFLFRMIRFPDRFNVVLSLPIAILAGVGVTELLREYRSKFPPTLLIASLTIFIVGEYANAYPMLSLATPDWYQSLPHSDDSISVVDIPIYSTDNDKFVKQYMMYQLDHGMPLIEGRIARTPRDAYEFMQGNPLLNHLLTSVKPPEDIPNISHQLQSLADADVQYVILHKAFLRAEEIAAWKDWFVINPYHEDSDLLVYHPTIRGIDQDTPYHYQALFDDSVVLIDAKLDANTAVQGQWTGVKANWGSLEAIDQDYILCINLSQDMADPAASYCEPLVPEWSTSNWQENEIVHATQPFQIDPFLPPANYLVNLNLFDDDGNKIGQTENIGTILIEPLPRHFSLPTTPNALNVTWDEQISLLGYDMKLTENPTAPGSDFELAVYWQAHRRLTQSYKVFVHLINNSTGDIMAQADIVPLDWTYPTNWWEQGEVVHDTITLPINKMPRDGLQVWIGLYDPDTSIRLPITSAENARVTEEAFLIATLR